MNFTEDDIDFTLLNYSEFEELCYDLLLKMGFYSLVWRRGGSDGGRDIEAYYNNTSPIVEPYSEKWFFECKHYAGGIPVQAIADKFDWAEAETANHLVILTSSYLSYSARQFVEKRMKRASFQFQLVEEKMLKQKILGFSELVIRYFKNEYFKLLNDSQRNWYHFNMLPNKKALHIFSTRLEHAKLNSSELVFLWTTLFFSKDGNDFSGLDGVDIINLEHLVQLLKAQENTDLTICEEMIEDVYSMIIGNYKEHKTYNTYLGAVLKINYEGNVCDALYSFVFSDDDDNAIETLLIRNNIISPRIRYFNSQAGITMSKMANIFSTILKEKYQLNKACDD